MARAGLGWSAADVAEAAGLTRLTVARYESGKGISAESQAAIERALTEAGAQFSRRTGKVAVAVPE